MTGRNRVAFVTGASSKADVHWLVKVTLTALRPDISPSGLVV
jgi:hypothetical protein